MTTVRTTRGRKPAEDLLKVLAYEHLFPGLFPVYQPHRDLRLADEALAFEGVGAFDQVGRGRLVVELTTPDLGRRPKALARVANKTGVDIVMGAGRYQTVFYEPDRDYALTEDLASRFITDIREGVGGVLPGIVGEIGTDSECLSTLEERAHRAAAMAAEEEGLAVITHSLGNDVRMAQLRLLDDEGLPDNSVVTGHAETFVSRAGHRDLMKSGAHLIFDTVRGLNAFCTRRTIDMLGWELEAGYEDAVMLSHDVCSTRHCSAYGGNGYIYVRDGFEAEMRKAGVPALAVAQFPCRKAADFLKIDSENEPVTEFGDTQ